MISKWWGGPLATMLPAAAMQGLGMGHTSQPTTVAPLMPSLSGLMAAPASMNTMSTGGGLGNTVKPESPIRAPERPDYKARIQRAVPLPDEFYGPPTGARPRDFIPPSPEEQKLDQSNPERFGHPTAGLLHSKVPGRTDQLPITVSVGSYVIPADVVSGLGQGNTLAGAHLLEEIIGPSATGTKMAAGGSSGTTPIVAAGGEYIVPPAHVARLGKGNEAKGHAILDNLVKSVRTATAKRLTKLPPPRNS